jgi:glycosyltransferase involved in cell wall biosynthesis
VKSTMKIVSVVEAANLNAVAKVVLEFYRTARELAAKNRDLSLIEGSVITFDRQTDQSELPNEFVQATRASEIEIDVIAERRRFDLSIIPALRSIVEQRQPDIVVTHSVKSHFLMWRSRLWQKYSWIAFHHGYTTTDQKMRVYNRLDRWSLPKADLVVTVCQAFARELASSIGLPLERFVVQHNAIKRQPEPSATDVEMLRNRFGLDENECVILSIGRLSKEKAQADLISAFNGLCEGNTEIKARLIIVGDGPELESLRSAARASKHGERIVFAGQVSNVQPFYSIADVFVLPSHSEGSPNVLLEAMAANVPVVATAVGGVPEIVENDESALLVPASDPAALAAAIARVLSDDNLARRLTNRAAGLVVQNHSPEQYAQSLLVCYANTIARANKE